MELASPVTGDVLGLRAVMSELQDRNDLSLKQRAELAPIVASTLDRGVDPVDLVERCHLDKPFPADKIDTIVAILERLR